MKRLIAEYFQLLKTGLKKNSQQNNQNQKGNYIKSNKKCPVEFKDHIFFQAEIFALNMIVIP